MGGLPVQTPAHAALRAPGRLSDLSPHSDQVAVTICVRALRRKLDETFCQILTFC